MREEGTQLLTYLLYSLSWKHLEAQAAAGGRVWVGNYTWLLFHHQNLN